MSERGGARRYLSAVVRLLGGGLVMAIVAAVLGPPKEEGPSVAPIAWSLLLSLVASLGLATVYALGGQPQIEGALLFVSLGGLSVAAVLWAKRLMPQGPHVEEHELIHGEPKERRETEEAFALGAATIARRRFLRKLLAGAVGALAVTLLFPIRSLGTRPGGALFRTAWRRGVRAVTPDGELVRAADLAENALLTVFPEGHTEEADSQVVLIKLPARFAGALPGDPEERPLNLVAFSKICTHAGCPVGLYQADTAELFCPCHQSVFSVPRGAVPTAGPATRPLPRLPLTVDPEGHVVALGDFDEPVGPGFWRSEPGS